MWYTHSRSIKTKTAYSDFTLELLQSTLRTLVIVILSCSLLAFFILGFIFSELITPTYLLLAFGLLGLSGIVLWDLSHHELRALLVYQIGLTCLVTLGLILYPSSLLVIFYLPLPFMATLMIGWQAGVLMEFFVVGLIIILDGLGFLPPLMAITNLEIIFGSFFMLIIGWGATRSLMMITEWAVFYSEEAKKSLEEARLRQVELFETQEDLMTANTELARLSNRFKALQVVAEEARQAKAEFVAKVSHELRAPLNMIIGFSEMITRSPRAYGTKLPSTLLADIATIQRNAMHLSRLVDDVLDLSQIEAGRMAMSKEWVQVNEIIESAVISVRPLYESKNLYLNVDLPVELPKLFCDRTRIRQILINLLSNAGRFTLQGGVEIKVAMVEKNLNFSVTDTGPGIAAIDQEKLFTPFQQVDNSLRRQYSGSGLGLNISKHFVEMHNGRIWLESQLGVGTTFYFSLPIEPAPNLQPYTGGSAKRWVNEYAVRERRIRPYKAPPPNVAPRLVVVEKGQALQHVFNRYLNEVEITSYHELEYAVKDLNIAPAQALVVNTPEVLSGDNFSLLAQKMTDLPYGTPAIACWLPGREYAATELGAQDYLIKPVTSDTILGSIGRLGKNVHTILVVDDDPDLLHLFTRILSTAEPKYRVWRATNGQQALEIMRERQPDVVFLDLVMPGIDGYQVLRVCQKEDMLRTIPVIVISSTDPISDNAVCNKLLVGRRDNLTVADLIDFIQAVSGILIPTGSSVDQALPINHPGL